MEVFLFFFYNLRRKVENKKEMLEIRKQSQKKQGKKIYMKKNKQTIPLTFIRIN